MKIIIVILLLLSYNSIIAQAQKVESDSSSSSATDTIFKLRVLDNAEIDILSSFYKQQGANAAVSGGIGTEELTNFATSISVAIPLTDDDILSIDATISAYSSASSSNLNPFSGASDDSNDGGGKKRISSGASSGGDPGDDYKVIANSPWVASSSDAKDDIWFGGNIAYSHYSDDRNNIYSVGFSAAKEYDYSSLGISLGYTRFLNSKNTELAFKGNVFFDKWNPQYPAELNHYADLNGDLDEGFFEYAVILDKNGNPIDKDGPKVWSPNTAAIDDERRNTVALSMSLAQILSKRAQVSFFVEPTYQFGWLANPMQRVYFDDKSNYFIGNPSSVYVYNYTQNTDVYHLADDIERLPSSRMKFPLGARFSYYLNKRFILKLYYRYYFDDWGINSNTVKIELPIKLNHSWTLYPSYRFYNQSAAKYFAPYNKHLSTDSYYTSDYDLSQFCSNQYGLGVKYKDGFAKLHLWKIAFKSLSLDYNYYRRNIEFDAHIVSLGITLVIK